MATGNSTDKRRRETAAAGVLIQYGLVAYRNLDPADDKPYIVTAESNMSLAELEAFAAMVSS